VEQGRVIFNNIRRFVIYLLSCNLSEILVVSLASFMGLPLPLLPLQILFLNLITDVFPALALGVGEGEPGVMRQPVRRAEKGVLTTAEWMTIGGYSALITGAVLLALFAALQWLGFPQEQAVTVSFLTLAFGQLWHVFNMKSRRSKLLGNEITRNRFVWGAIALCAGLLVAAVYLPGLSTVLKLTGPGAAGWAVVAGAGLVPLVLAQVVELLRSLARKLLHHR
jgi:Ca2+-transporting ATPase